MTNSDIPSKFQPLIDSLVEQALKGQSKVSSQELGPLHEWLEYDGYEWFLEGWKDELALLDLKPLANWGFSDGELIACMGIDESEEIDNTLRIQYARERIEYALDSGGDEDVSTVHRLPLTADSGKRAILGYRTESRGQGGRELLCEGVFKNDQDFLDHLAQQNFVMLDGSTHISDATILSLWQK